jgi:hypothetical protein
VPALPRLIGAATLAYSAAVLAKPELLARPCELTDDQGQVPGAVAAAVRAVAARDAVISAVMLVAPAGAALRAVTTARALCDLTDVVTLGVYAQDPKARAKVVGVAGGWGALGLLSRCWA